VDGTVTVATVVDVTFAAVGAAASTAPADAVSVLAAGLNAGHAMTENMTFTVVGSFASQEAPTAVKVMELPPPLGPRGMSVVNPPAAKLGVLVATRPAAVTASTTPIRAIRVRAVAFNLCISWLLRVVDTVLACGGWDERVAIDRTDPPTPGS
jgi:hypothetical protein